MAAVRYGHQSESSIPSRVVEPVATNLISAVHFDVVNLTVLSPEARIQVEQLLHPEALGVSSIS